jgi:hypothetical protein
MAEVGRLLFAVCATGTVAMFSFLVIRFFAG